MKWGTLPNDSRDLLFWVLWIVIGTYDELPIDHFLKRILTNGGGLGGDPGWEMEPVTDQNGLVGYYRVSANPEMSGIRPAESIYRTDIVHRAMHEALLAYAEDHPEKKKEVNEIIHLYKLGHNYYS